MLLKDFVDKFLKKNVSKGVGVGGLHESVKKENRDENLFQITLNEVLKCCNKYISTDIKTDVKQEIKELAQ